MKKAGLPIPDFSQKEEKSFVLLQQQYTLLPSVNLDAH
jgi:hypothetical protein